MKKNITIPMLAVALLVGTVAQTQTDYIWLPTGNGDWNTAANWSPSGGPPTTLDDPYIRNGGTATIIGNSAAHVINLARNSGESGNIIHYSGTVTATAMNVGRGGSGTYTLIDGRLDFSDRLRLGTNNGNGIFTMIGGQLNISNEVRVGVSTSNPAASSFSQTGGSLDTDELRLEAAGSLYEISGGAVNSNIGFWRQADTTVRIVGGAASIDIAGTGFRDDSPAQSSTAEFVLDNSATHISTVIHSGSGLRRQGKLVVDLQGGILLTDDNQFNLVRSDSTMLTGWSSTPGDLWTYSGNVLDAGRYYERITLDAAADKGDLDASSPGSSESFTDAAFGYVDLTGTGASLDLKLEWSASSGATISDFTDLLTDAGITNWLVSANEIGITLDAATSGGNFFAWDTQGIGSGDTDGLISAIEVIPEPSTFFLLSLAAVVLMRTRQRFLKHLNLQAS
jgi:hypothetical protein